MGSTRQVIVFVLLRLSLCSANTYSVKITTEQHVNLVDNKFLSFTIDPKYLFSSSEKYSSKECICMASSLTPAYIRIAGPSTAHMTFHNTTISINDIDFPDLDNQKTDFDISNIDSDVPKKVPLGMNTRNLAVSHRQWKKFVQWAKSTGFDLVFALNNEERTAAGMWDPNTALNILTVAEKVKVGDIFWELGYECTNQSIEEYLNDLETLRVIIETFPPGRTAEWKVVGGDVTKCLQADSKSDFKDYLTLSNDMMDALLLNGNSTSYELDRMSEHDRLKLLRLLARSATPLWLTETNLMRYNALERAADWLASLGYSAKNGFGVHFRELEEEEMYEPTLSFYMALLFKNLVGERVLDVQMEPEQAILFAHCTSLRHKPVNSAVTLFAVNMDDEPARFSLKLSQTEEGGDIMQFILGNDYNGNIMVNGRAMYYEGDIKPVVKRVRPYKTLLINLPPKSFGFWVLANTKIEACQDLNNKTYVEAETVTKERHRVKRSVEDFDDDYTHIADLSYDFDDTDSFITDNKALISRITDINRDLDKIQNVFQRNKNSFLKEIKDRVKREGDEDDFRRIKLRRQGIRNRSNNRRADRDLDPKNLIGSLLEKARQKVDDLKNLRPLKSRFNTNRVSKRHSKHSRKSLKALKEENKIIEKIFKRPKYHKKISEDNNAFLKKVNRKTKTENEIPKNSSSDKSEKIVLDVNKSSGEEIKTIESVVRKRRSTDDVAEISAENDIDLHGTNKAKLWKMLKKINEELKDYSPENADHENESNEGIVLQTELADDVATIKVKDSNHGVIKSTLKSMLHVFEDLNKNLNRVWNAISLLD